MTAVAFFTSSHRADWAGRWHRHARDHGGANVVDVIAERQTAFDRPWQVLVADASSALIEPGFVSEAHEAGRGVLAVWDPTEPAGKQRAIDAGVDEYIESDATAAEFVTKVTAMAGAFPVASGPPAARRGRRRPAGDPVPRRTGQLVAVGGPVGADPEPVALGLARATSHRGESTLLVDANEVCAAVAQLLDLAAVPNLASALATARAGNDPAEDLQVADRFHVLAGLADPGQWAEVGGRPVWALVTSMAARFERTVVAVGPVAENLGHHGDRFGTTRAMLAEADAIVAVGVADPVGIARLTVWVADARAIAPSTPLYLAAGAAPGDRFRKGEVRRLLAELGQPAETFLLPAPDGRVTRAAWQGRMPKGALMAAVAQMADVVAPKKGRRG